MLFPSPAQPPGGGAHGDVTLTREDCWDPKEGAVGQHHLLRAEHVLSRVMGKGTVRVQRAGQMAQAPEETREHQRRQRGGWWREQALEIP